jgi:hypothetical protein
MKNRQVAVAISFSFIFLQNIFGQGFENLDFESANVSQPLSGNYGYYAVSASAAIPGWTVYQDQSGLQKGNLGVVGYNTPDVSLSIIDTNFGGGFIPFQGHYSVNLFSDADFDVEASISQTGLVPAGTQSLFMDASYSGAPFIVTLGSETLNMLPLQTFSNYTLYGANISSFANEVENLTILEPIPDPLGSQSTDLILDNIQFSSQPVPEPNTLSFSSISILLFFWRMRLIKQSP